MVELVGFRVGVSGSSLPQKHSRAVAVSRRAQDCEGGGQLLVEICVLHKSAQFGRG